jgi:uncharacterized iron-regulated protein
VGLAPHPPRVRCSFRLVLLAFLLLPLFGCATVRPDGPLPRPAPGVLFSPGGEVRPGDLPGLSSGMDFVVIGEGHTNPCDHDLQERILRSLAPLRPVLGLEMVDVTRQEVLDRFNRGEITVEGMEGALDWGTTWGHPFALYRPLFEIAAERSIPVHALNLPSIVVRTVGREGLQGLDAEEFRRWVPDPLIPPAPEQLPGLRAQHAMHRAMLGEREGKESQERFLLAQSLWDTFMAKRAVELSHSTGSLVVVVAGSGHVEHGWGIPRRIRAIMPEAEILTIVPWRGGDPPVEGEGDLFFHCPERHKSRLGFELEEVEGPGVAVLLVQPGSRAEKAGILAGDRIVSAGGVEVRSMLDLHKGGMAAGKAGIPLVLEVLRDGETIAVEIGAAEKEAQ